MFHPSIKIAIKISPLSEKYNSGEILEDRSESVFIALPQNPGANECEYQKIRLMNHKTKLIRILMNKACNRIRPEIVQEVCGFVKDTEARNVLFIIRIISERAILNAKECVSVFYSDCKTVTKNCGNC